MSRNLSVGVVISAAAGVLFLAVLLVGQEQALFTPRNEYVVLLPNAEGLQTGSPVKLVGVQVGAISEIRLPEELGEQMIRVTLSVNRAYADWIREDSAANLRVLSLLGGEKYIELTLGSPEMPALEPGSEITAPLSDFDQIFARGSNIAGDLAEITATLRVIFERIERREGLLGQLLMEPDFGRESLDDLRASLASVRQVTADLQQGRGLVGALLSDEEFRRRITDGLGDLVENVNALAAAARNPDTTIGALLSEEGAGDRVVENLERASEAFRRVAEGLERGEGLLGRLTADGDYADRVLGDLEATLRNLASITGKVDRGQGSLGGLVNDPALYQGLRDVVTGVQESRLLRWMVNRYARKGARAGS